MRMAHVVSLLLGILGFLYVASAQAQEPADTIYKNGKIYTVDKAQPWAEAVAIKDGKFLVVGSDADAETVTGEGTEVIDLDGAFAMPGVHNPRLRRRPPRGRLDTRRGLVSRPVSERKGNQGMARRLGVRPPGGADRRDRPQRRRQLRSAGDGGDHPGHAGPGHGPLRPRPGLPSTTCNRPVNVASRTPK